MRTSTLHEAAKSLNDFFDTLPSKVFSKRDLSQLLLHNKELRKLKQRYSIETFIEKMKELRLKEVTLFSPNYPKTFTRFVWGPYFPVYQISLSLRSHSFLCHHTAMYLHGLTDKKLKSIYVNSEQSIKPNRDTTMEQARIDFAFQRKPRISKYVFVLDAYKICCLNGLNTNNLGVEHISIPEEGDLVVTNPERTLIDITVRPIYAGGCGEVAQAYERAKNRIVVDRMITILKKINYVYPYHQAIGFYMQLAGFDERSFIKLKKMGMKYDFYLDHDMKAKKYSPEWRMYYPAKL